MMSWDRMCASRNGAEFMSRHPRFDVLSGLDLIHLTLRNGGGSVEHYYHFLLGFLTPLVNWRSASGNSMPGTILIRSCGPLDALLRELAVDNLVIMDRDEHAGLLDQRTYQGRPLSHVTLGGSDSLNHHNAVVFSMAASEIARLVGANLASEEISAADRPIRILLVGRASSDPFYLSEAAEIKSSGAARRSVPNLDEVADALSRWSERTGVGIVDRALLEGRSLREQILLFNNADIVISQHGAALANLIFCRRGTGVVEWLPKDLVRKPVSRAVRVSRWIRHHVLRLPACEGPARLFPSISRHMGLRHLVLTQHHSHAPVRINSVLKAVSRLTQG
jgi:hypothetical protein